MILLLATFFGLNGIFWAVPIADLGAFVITIFCFIKAIKKLRTNSGEKEMIIKNGYEMVMRKFFLPTNVRQIFKLYQGS